MAEILKTTFLLRRGKTEAWERNNPILQCGEPGFEIDKNKLKIGDGVTAWNDLSYQGGNFTLEADGAIVIDNNTIRLLGFDAAEIGAQPRKGKDGQLEWYVPASDSIEGLQSTVTNLQIKVDELEAEISTLSAESTEIKEQIKEVEVATKNLDGGEIV